MQKISYMLPIFFLMVINGSAQDLIIMKNGDEIKSKVKEITLDVIKYRKHENPDGPVISVLKSEVFMIKYENGTKDIFTKEKKENTEVNYQPVNKDNKDESTTVTYSKVTYKRTVKDNPLFHLIKLNPLLIFNGDIPIYYERRFNDHTTAEVGVGITQQDYVYEGSKSEIQYLDPDRKANFGYSFTSSIRYYPSKYTKALDEFYAGLEFRLRRYNTELVSFEGIPLESPVPEYRTYIDFNFLVGYIHLISDVVFVEPYGGLGIRSMKINVASVSANSVVSTLVLPTPVSGTATAISLGCKVGFGF